MIKVVILALQAQKFLRNNPFDSFTATEIAFALGQVSDEDVDNVTIACLELCAMDRAVVLNGVFSANTLCN